MKKPQKTVIVDRVISLLKMLFVPNQDLPKPVEWSITFSYALAIGLWWVFGAAQIIPRPLDVWYGLIELWTQKGLAWDLLKSFKLMFISSVISFILSLSIVYLRGLAAFRPISRIVALLRFIPIAILLLIFMTEFGGSESLKISIMTFILSVFFIHGMNGVVDEQFQYLYEHAYTLGMSEWRVLYEVVILGTFPLALTNFGAVFGFGWAMLTSVEKLVLSGGGVGVLVSIEDKFMKLSNLFAIMFLLLFAGLLFDYLWGKIRTKGFRWSTLKLKG